MPLPKILAESVVITRTGHDGEYCYSLVSGGNDPAKQVYVPSKPIDAFLLALREKLENG